MKKTKILSIILASALIIGVIVSGTMAYLTDSEGKINVMTVGNVNIELYELQREFKDNNGVLEPEKLVDFEQGKTLLPLVGSAQGAKDKFGMPVAANFVDKIVYVENTGKNDAYVRVLVALPEALDDLKDPSKNYLHYSFGNRVDVTGQGLYNNDTTEQWNARWTWKEVAAVGDIEIDGEEYNVYTFVLPEVVKPGAETVPVIAGVYLDSYVDYNEDTDTWIKGSNIIDYELAQGVKVPVLAQAVQADGFATAEEAFKAAFEPVGPTYNPWSEVVFVNTEAELKEAVKSAGKTVTLASDIELTANLKLDNSIILDGNGFEISGDNYSVYVAPTANVAIKNVTFNNAKTGKLSSIYATNYAGLLSIVDCDFIGAAWENIQATPVSGAKIVVKENTFSADENLASFRYLHIQASNKTPADAKVVVENNVFNVSDNLGNAVDIDYIAANNIKVGGNEITPRNGVDDIYICDFDGTMHTALIADFTK